jgi:tetratricopeptide (TPR) repeat protein
LSYRFAICLTLVIVGLHLHVHSQEVPTQAANSQQLDQNENGTEFEATLIASSKAHPTDPLPLAQLGLLEARRGNLPQAIVFYRRAMLLKPGLPGLRLNLGLALFKDGQYKEAIQMFTLELRSQPPPSSSEKQRLNVLLGMSHYGLAEYSAAVLYLKYAVDRDPQNLPLLLTLAHSCLLSKQYPCVLDAYHRMIAQNAESAEADMLVGEALDEMKDTNGATREFRAAVQANPKEPNVHFGLGYLLWTQLQFQEASQEFQAELQNTPDYSKAMLYLADSDIKLSRNEEAKPLLERVVATDPTNSMGRLDLGVVYAEAGQKEDAVREFKVAATLNPNDVNVHMWLGRLYRSMGNVNEARTEFDKAKSLNRESHDALITVMSNAREKDNRPSSETPTK